MSVVGTVQASSGGSFTDVSTFGVQVVPVKLAKGATQCWPYEAEFTPVATILA